MFFPRRLGGLLFVGFAIAGCDDPVRPDRTHAPGRATLQQGAASLSRTGGPELVSNRVRYRDTGFRPATGRSGGAELQARALISRDGTAALDVATGDFEGWWSTGTLRNVKVSLLDEEGGRLWSRAYQSPDASMASYPLPGAAPGSRVQVQGTVKLSWSFRTGLVVLSETVRRRPDLEVMSLTLPSEARLRAPTLIHAVVGERNGEMGARGTCAVYVDGVRQDWMDWVWGDAGGTVTCAFVVVFREPGTRTVRVAIDNVNPGDWDESNNAMEGTLEVSDQVGFEWWAHAQTDEEPFFYRYRSEYRAMNPDGVLIWDEAYLDESSGQSQQAGVNGWLPAKVSFPLEAIYLRQETGDRVFHSQTLRDLNPTWAWEEEDWGEACVSGWGRGPVLGFVTLNLCTGYARMWNGEMNEWTWVDYGRNAGEVTYHSSGYSRYFDEWTGEEFFYSWNYDSEWNEPGFFPYGDDYTLEVRVTDQGREHPIRAVVPLESWVSDWEEPFACWDWYDEWSGWTSTYCYGEERSEHIRSGWASSNDF